MAKFESFDGTKLSYEVDGSGPPVVLLHGYVSDSFINWVRPGLIDKLTEAGYQAIALDQRGHGMSEKPHQDSAYTDGAMVKDARALLDELQIERCFLVGYSMGARNTLDVITRDEPRVRAAVLGGIGSNMLAARDHGGALADAMLAEDKSSITNAFAKSFRDFADLVRGDRQALAAIMRQPREAFGDLSKIDIPVLILVADNDPMIGDPEALAEKIPGAKVATVGGSHLNVVNNQEFHKELIKFLDEHREEVGG